MDLPRKCPACQLAAEQSTDAENVPPHTCQETVDEAQAPASRNQGNTPQTSLEFDEPPSASDVESATSANSTPSTQNRNAFDEGFANDLLNVLNGCSRIQYEQNRHTTSFNASTYANAMNSYLEGGGDRNLSSFYETARMVSSVEGYVYNVGDRYRTYMWKGKQIRDVGVMTDHSVFSEGEDDDVDDEEDEEEEEDEVKTEYESSDCRQVCEGNDGNEPPGSEKNQAAETEDVNN